MAAQERSQYGVREVRISRFRSARSVRFAPGRVCALVGGLSVGKSNVLAAVWTLLQHGSPEPQARVYSTREAPAIELAATLADREEILAPDFEAVAGLRGHRHKPAHAWRRFAHVQRERVPPVLIDAVEKAVTLARG